MILYECIKKKNHSFQDKNNNYYYELIEKLRFKKQV